MGNNPTILKEQNYNEDYMPPYSSTQGQNSFEYA